MKSTLINLISCSFILLALGCAEPPLGPVADSLSAKPGAELFQNYSCVNCHTAKNQILGPLLDGLYGSEVTLADGTKVHADENYIRESIISPRAKISAGDFETTMPTFSLTEEQVSLLIEYIKSLPAAT